IGWAVDAGVDFIVGETYSWGSESLLALEAIRRSGKPAVITLSVPREGRMRDGWTVSETCKRLQDGGADVVGLNSARAPPPPPPRPPTPAPAAPPPRRRGCGRPGRPPAPPPPPCQCRPGRRRPSRRSRAS